MTSSRIEAYRAVVERILGRPLGPEDATPEARLAQAEQRLGLTLPASLREFLLLAGEADRACRAFNVLFRPEELRAEDGHLVFMEENQAVVHWGIPLDALSHADPGVWQRVNSEPPVWFPEEMTVGVFLVENLAWQAGLPAAGA